MEMYILLFEKLRQAACVGDVRKLIEQGERQWPKVQEFFVHETLYFYTPK